MHAIPHVLFTNRQLALFPDVVAARQEAALDRREEVITRLLRTGDAAGILVHVSAITSPYDVEARAQGAVTRAYAASDTEEEAEDRFLEWVDTMAKTYLFD